MYQVGPEESEQSAGCTRASENNPNCVNHLFTSGSTAARVFLMNAENSGES